jgi:hypothetical protein
MGCEKLENVLIGFSIREYRFILNLGCLCVCYPKPCLKVLKIQHLYILFGTYQIDSPNIEETAPMLISYICEILSKAQVGFVRLPTTRTSIGVGVDA